MPAYENLKTCLGLEHETKFLAKRARTVIPDESVLRRLDIDTRPLFLGDYTGNMSHFIDEHTFKDAWGTTWKKAPDGHFINAIGPFQDKDPDVALLESFNWPDADNPGLFEGLRERAEALHKGTDYAVILVLPVGIVHQCQFIRGFAEYLMDLVSNEEYVCRMMDIVAGIWIKIAQNALEFEALKSRGGAKVHFHSCGSIYTLINDLIEIGMNALNPLQVNAKDMDPARLKEEFGERITFWGGIDTQKILPFGSPQEVRQEVRKMIDVMGPGGGYILASVHNIQAEVPPENIVAMFEEGKAYGVYRH
jgi:uroporphyrinogen decarboxylase